MSSLPYAEVIGDPIAHSKSPVIHNHWLRELDIEAEYRKTHVTREGLAAYFLSRRADPDWLGCNVTIPHKVAVMDYVEDPGDVRGRIGAMNTIACETGGPLIGTNTDAGGFLQPLDAIGWRGEEAVLVGAGGAALAIGFALGARGVRHLTVMARDPAKGQALLDRCGLEGCVIAFTDTLPATRLLVNSSPLGMTGQPPLDLDLAPLPDDATVYDIVYAPLETGLLGAARNRGLATIDGLAMLIGQAALAFEIFFDALPPRDDNDAALRALLTA
ncbi:MAG TPA: shikimate dehydrogenase [Sphingobium sp.]|nr:shikimate dehydrogenase [Sphingobium sp.]